MSSEKYVDEDAAPEGIAIIGMAGRFPGAENVDAFWQNLINDVSSIRAFTDEECRESGVPDSLLNNTNFVKRGGLIDHPELFDAGFFSYSPAEAQYMDPQHRIFLECAWEAIENAGYDSESFQGEIGVYAGCGINNYLLKNLLSTNPIMESVVTPMTFFGNEKDFLTTRVSYKLNLTGPSITVQTACSASLVAVQLACQGLMTHQCDMALSGGVSLQTPRMKGYLYTEGQILSDDGYCRAFDKKASGTVFGEGAGIVVLKRLEDAIADRDTIYAVIEGIAVNNDGADKVGYTAPSVNGQAHVVAIAQALAGVEADAISYIETHGTGTHMGDVVEITALTQAFQETTDKKSFCAIGSVKPNIGHLDVAAGVAGLIKVALAHKYKKLPRSLYYEEANPDLNLDKSPFFVLDKLTDWETNGRPRMAGVSSFGIGGTNVHAVLSEAPNLDTNISFKPAHLLLLSAKSERALQKATENLREHLKTHSNINLADAAYTLQLGRKHFKHRRAIVCEDVGSAAGYLDSLDIKRVVIGETAETARDVVFMFTGQGSQYVDMGKELYLKSPVFKHEIDQCAEILQPILGLDLRQILFPNKKNAAEAEMQLGETAITQPALFVIEYAMAKLMMHCGVTPSAMTGHSIGEYVAACLSGVFTLKEALSIIAERGRLMQQQKKGDMLAVMLPESDVASLLNTDISIAAVNSPAQTVLSGTVEKIEVCRKKLLDLSEKENKKIRHIKLNTSHAFHSNMMQPAVKPFLELLSKINLQPPQIPFISNVTGDFISSEQAVDPKYWAEHIMHTVRFSGGINTLLSEPGKIMLEIGPGMTLASLARLHVTEKDHAVCISSMRQNQQKESDYAFFLKTLGQLWIEGVPIDWNAYHQDELRMRIPLPTYPFERERYWVEQRQKPAVAYNGSFQDTRGPWWRQIGAGLATAVSKIPLVNRIAKSSTGTINNDLLTGIEANEFENGVELRLAAIWKKVMGLKSVSREDDFYNLGGHSLLAAQLFAEIENVFQKSIPLSVLFHSATIAKLAYILRAEDTDNLWSSLVPIKVTGSKPPLFMAHGAEGNVLLYRSLSKYMDDDQPIYGLQAEGLSGKEKFDSDFKIVADKYVKEIKTVQKEGPYFLGGYCLGGTLALEMAQQLIAQGEKVNLVAMIEIYNIRSLKKWPLPRYILAFNSWLNVWYHFLNLISPDNDAKWEFFKEKAAVEISRLKVLMSIGSARLLEMLGGKTGRKYHHVRVDEAFDQALEAYQLRKYPGKLTIFIPKTLPAGFTDPDTYGFDEVAEGGVDTQVIPVYPRGTMVEPFVKVLAEKLTKCIQQAG